MFFFRTRFPGVPAVFRRRTVYRESAREGTQIFRRDDAQQPRASTVFSGPFPSRTDYDAPGVRKRKKAKKKCKGEKATVYYLYLRARTHNNTRCMHGKRYRFPRGKGGDAAILITRPNRRRGPIDKRCAGIEEERYLRRRRRRRRKVVIARAPTMT